MSAYHGIFYAFELLAAAGVVGLVLSRNVFYAAMFLMVTLLAIAGLYVLTFAEFLAVTQILVYAGGILVVILFGIMITAKIGGAPPVTENHHVFTGLLVAIPLFAMLIYFFSEQSNEPSSQSPLQNNENLVASVGTTLMTEHLLVFEVAGVLLLLALIGAAVIASHKPKES